MTEMLLKVEEIKERFLGLKEDKPKIRARDAAAELDISEGELLAAQVGPSVIRLKDEPLELLRGIEKLGEVMALTRNEFCVHERKGVYKDVQAMGTGKIQHVLLINPDIDLRIFINQWAYCFAVLQQEGAGPRSSLQIFDKSGCAIHKIYLIEHSDETEYGLLVDQFTADEQTAGIQTEAPEPAAVTKADSEVNWEKFRSFWEKMQDVHEFFGLLRKFKVSRLQGHRHIGLDFSAPVTPNAARRVLELAAEKELEIMVFVGNRGLVQIHTGIVSTLKAFGDWYNVLDPKFSLHLDETGISECWITRKPTKDGLVSSLEVFNKDGELIVTFFGRRTEGNPEQELWREILAELQKTEALNVA